MHTVANSTHLRKKPLRHIAQAGPTTCDYALSRHQLPQHRLEADAALAGERGGFAFRAVIVIAAGKADADFVAAEHRPLAPARRVLVIDQFALPAALRAAVSADIVEEGIAAADAAVMQHHDAGVAGVDAVEHPDVERIESVGDTVGSAGARRWRRILADPSQHSLDGA